SNLYFFFSSRRRHTRFSRDWSSDVCSSDLQFITDTADAVDGERSKSLGIITIMPPPGVILHVDSISCRWEKGGFGGSGGLDGGRSEERRVGKECRWVRRPAPARSE